MSVKCQVKVIEKREFEGAEGELLAEIKLETVASAALADYPQHSFHLVIGPKLDRDAFVVGWTYNVEFWPIAEQRYPG